MLLVRMEELAANVTVVSPQEMLRGRQFFVCLSGQLAFAVFMVLALMGTIAALPCKKRTAKAGRLTTGCIRGTNESNEKSATTELTEDGNQRSEMLDIGERQIELDWEYQKRTNTYTVVLVASISLETLAALWSLHNFWESFWEYSCKDLIVIMMPIFAGFVVALLIIALYIYENLNPGLFSWYWRMRKHQQEMHKAEATNTMISIVQAIIGAGGALAIGLVYCI